MLCQELTELLRCDGHAAQVKKLGEGAFATVEQCVYTPKSGAKPAMVAVKKLKPEVKANEEDMVSFMSEASAPSGLTQCSRPKCLWRTCTSFPALQLLRSGESGRCGLARRVQSLTKTCL